MSYAFDVSKGSQFAFGDSTPSLGEIAGSISTVAAVAEWYRYRTVACFVTDEQALHFAAEDNAKVLWDKIRATYIGEGEDRKIDAGNELKNIRMKNGETVADYIARARGFRLSVIPLDWTCRRGNWSTIPLED
ncbi:RBR-type E3 ubiquitin transferase [Trichonephila clavipes]|nr:RBR-type E3 ubiquitin transferase [Trichonephila clavipes]